MALRYLATGAVIAAGTLLGLGQAAHADLFIPDSSYTVQGTDPITGAGFSDTVALTSGSNTLVDGGAINVSFTLVPALDGQGGEWLVFKFSTTGNLPPLAPPSDDWDMLETGLQAAEPLYFNAAYAQFNDNGAAETPTSNLFGGYSIGTDPVPGDGTGEGFVNLGPFLDPIAPGPVGSLGTFIDPFSFISSSGISAADTNGYEEALLFDPQTPVTSDTPEPASLALLGAGLAGLGFMRRRKRA